VAADEAECRYGSWMPGLGVSRKPETLPMVRCLLEAVDCFTPHFQNAPCFRVDVLMRLLKLGPRSITPSDPLNRFDDFTALADRKPCSLPAVEVITLFADCFDIRLGSRDLVVSHWIPGMKNSVALRRESCQILTYRVGPAPMVDSPRVHVVPWEGAPCEMGSSLKHV